MAGSYDPDANLQYNVDVALNGQQFTGRPVVFRYYDIRLEKILPAFAQSCGGAQISLTGKGIYDSAIKKLKFTSVADPTGQREIAAEWDKKRRCLQFRLPPLAWLWGEDGENMEQEKLAQVMAQPIKVFLTFNNQEWIAGPSFEYHDHTLARLRYGHAYMDEAPAGEERPEWEDEVPEEEAPADLTEE